MNVDFDARTISVLDEVAAQYGSKPEIIVIWAVQALVDGKVAPFREWIKTQ